DGSDREHGAVADDGAERVVVEQVGVVAQADEALGVADQLVGERQPHRAAERVDDQADDEDEQRQQQEEGQPGVAPRAAPAGGGGRGGGGAPPAPAAPRAPPPRSAPFALFFIFCSSPASLGPPPQPSTP